MFTAIRVEKGIVNHGDTQPNMTFSAKPGSKGNVSRPTSVQFYSNERYPERNNIIVNAPPLVEEKDKDWPDFPFAKSDPGLGYGKATKQNIRTENGVKTILIHWEVEWDFTKGGNRFKEIFFDTSPKDGSGITP